MFKSKRRLWMALSWGIIFVTIVLMGVGVWFALAGRKKIPIVVGKGVEGLTDELKRELPHGIPDIRFTNVNQEAGIHFVHSQGDRTSVLPEDMGSGAAWGDYDGDGDLDLYVVNHPGPWTPGYTPRPGLPTNALYRNNGDGTFTDIATQAGVALRLFGMGASWADYDADGDLDLYVSNVGANVLFRNKGNGTFQDVTNEAGVGDSGFGATCVWADYDLDGDLDLYVPNYVDFVFDSGDLAKSSDQFGNLLPFTINPSSYRPSSNLLYRNNGNGTFTDVAKDLGVRNSEGRSLSATWADLDNDGWPDLYVANDISSSVLYRNLKGKRFEDIGGKAWIAEYRGSMGLAVQDVDDDGDLDVFISHWVGQENSLYRNLIREVGELRFADIADLVGLGAIALQSVGWGTEFFDIDNDGRLDLFVANGHTLQKNDDPKKLIPQTNMLFWNKGEESFFDITELASPELKKTNVARGAAFGDYDADGDIDFFLTRNHGPAVLFRNDSKTDGHWLRVYPKGQKGNPRGIGARVYLQIGKKTYFREIGTSPSYLSQNEVSAHFGLGFATEVDSLKVVWPGGQEQMWKNVKVDRMYIAQYGDGNLLSEERRGK